MSGDKDLLDTNIVLYILNANNDLINFLNKQHVCISIITEMELLSFPGISKQEAHDIGDFINKIKVEQLDEHVKNVAVSLRKKFKLKLPDSIIAATAIVHEIPLITADKQFQIVSGLHLLLYNPVG